MPAEHEPIEAATWLEQCRIQLRFGPASINTDPKDTKLARLILESIEVDDLPKPICMRDQDGAVLINWRHDANDDVSRCLSIRVQDQNIFFIRHLNARPLPIARRCLAKGTPAAVRELLQWVFTSDIHRQVEDVSELLRGD